MLKQIAKFLSFIAVFIIIAMPASSIFRVKQQKCPHHASYTQHEKPHQHLDHYQPDHSWTLIKNKHLSAPPLPLKVKNAAIISLLFFFSLVFKNSLSRSNHTAFTLSKNSVSLIIPKYLSHKVFLI
ncbi:hypothetical protein KXQ82_15080 [Mucilaginibacter sp. HMF5004]|uniref:hypothetical protein n=1 Tax=Mucilaginibacter rivuli TaxID=2857527 RepID=UPI001C5D6031|nr:hypothetical protein [Mucilaginibacter rivuli]MBW4891048.1 hypothetical protein [Mucilaginibacter rivuli]